MPRKSRPPAYPRTPHSTGQARIRLNGRDIYLGSWGSEASYAAYERQIAKWRAHVVRGVPLRAEVATVGDLADHMATWTKKRYRSPDGTPSGEVANYRDALKGVTALYADIPVQDFGPVALEAVRQAWVDRGVSRRVANARTKRVQRLWRQAVALELIPLDLAARLGTLGGIPIGTPGVKDYDDVPPVPDADLARTLPHLGPVPRAMVELQLLTGARPGEICRLRPCDLDRSERVELGRGRWLDTAGKVWVKVFRRFGTDGQLDQGGRHKNLHRGHARVLLFGPKSQTVLIPFLNRLPTEYCFSPADNLRLVNAARAAKRKTPRQPSQVARANGSARPEAYARRPYYTVDIYGKAVARACKRAGVPQWHVHQLRHNAATTLVEQFGWEVARLVLGHKTLQTTRRYGLDPLANALPAVLKLG